MKENPYKLKSGHIGITDPSEPRGLLARGWQEGAVAIVKWMDELCPHSLRDFGGIFTQTHKRNCDLCWNELLESIKE